MSEPRDTLQALRLKYNAAVAAHQGCTRALAEASLSGASPPSALIEMEVKARQELDRARDRLLEAVTAAITGEARTTGGESGDAPSRHETDPPERLS